MRRRSRHTPLAVLAAACLIAAPAAHAQSGVTPPGNSALEQYLETVPSAGGSKVPGGGEGGSRTNVPAAVARQLEQAGADGQKVRELLETTATQEAVDKAAKRKPSSSSSSSSSSSGSSSSGGTPAVSGSGSAPTAVVKALTGDDAGGGFGVALPIFLLLSAAFGIGFVVLRGRSA